MRSKIKKSPEQKVSVSPTMLQCVSPLMAPNRPDAMSAKRSLLGAEQT